MKIERFFTRNISSPYEGIAFEARTSEIKNIDGSVVRRMKKVVVPSFWSQVATDILAQKYSLLDFKMISEKLITKIGKKT